MLNLDDDFMDPDKAEQLLNLNIGKTYSGHNILKSFYNFDFSTPEGVISFISLLPIVDETILKQASAELWPGSVDDAWDAKRARFEIRGYLMDTLDMGILADQDAEIEAATQAASEIKESTPETNGGQPGENPEEGDAPPTEDNNNE